MKISSSVSFSISKKELFSALKKAGYLFPSDASIQVRLEGEHSSYNESLDDKPINIVWQIQTEIGGPNAKD